GAVAGLLVTQDGVYIDLRVAAIELGVETGIAITDPPFADPGSPLQTCGRASGRGRELRDGDAHHAPVSRFRQAQWLAGQRVVAGRESIRPHAGGYSGQEACIQHRTFHT